MSERKNNPIYVVSKRLRASKVENKVNSPFLYDCIEVVMITSSLEKANEVYNSISLLRNRWSVVAKYIVKTELDVNFDDVDGLINQNEDFIKDK